MSKKKPNVKIENGKVILSDEVLSYFKSWETEENFEYIKRYKEVLLDSSNLVDDEFDIHHIRYKKIYKTIQTCIKFDKFLYVFS